ncbi:MAG TPA: hypothetical protein VFZ97_01660 [Acidimicrobiales bacterium]
MTRTGATPSPWGEPARMPPATSDAIRWERPGSRERARAVLTMFFVAIVLGAAAAGVLGIAVWAIAALFHHAASG